MNDFRDPDQSESEVEKDSASKPFLIVRATLSNTTDATSKPQFNIEPRHAR